jgi:hypothetical protein
MNAHRGRHSRPYAREAILKLTSGVVDVTRCRRFVLRAAEYGISLRALRLEHETKQNAWLVRSLLCGMTE